MAYKAVIFDLDGTLIDSIHDIADAINDALREIGIPLSYSSNDVAHKLIGSGADNLMHRALGEFDSEWNFDRLKSSYMPKYKAYQGKHTKAFKGIKKALKIMKNAGVHLFICTNKPHELARIIVDKIFGYDIFTEVLGQKPNNPVKPDPRIVNYFRDKYQLDMKSTLYVGDSKIDVDTANNASLNSCLVTWGYETYTWEVTHKATFVINEVKDLITIVL